jgi:HTH-type transcriptional regulator / antitoxin HipB
MFYILDNVTEMCCIQDMDAETSLHRLGQTLREARQRRGLTQAEVAQRAGLQRGRVIQAEQGDPSLSMRAYSALAAALDQEFALTPARLPTLEEIQELMRDA